MNPSHQKDKSRREFFILSRLSDCGPMSLLEIGFSASPQAVRNMAARGLVKVTVEMTNRGVEALEKEKAKRLRIKTNQQKAERIAMRAMG